MTVKTYAVTGASGFIGQRLVRHLASSCDVVAILHDARKQSSLQQSRVRVRIADVRDADALAAAFEGVDGVFHLSALFNQAQWNRQDYHDVNVSGTLNVLKAGKAVGVRRIVHCSTVGVASDKQAFPLDETLPYAPKPGDRYEETKAEGEAAARQWARANGLSLVVIRPTQVYGPGDLSKLKFYRLVKKGLVVDPGQTRKHPIHVDDLCIAFELAMTVPEADGEVFLVGNRDSVSLEEMIRIAADVLQVRAPRKVPAAPVKLACALVEDCCKLLKLRPPIHRRSIDFFTRSVDVNPEKARRVLGFSPSRSLEEGIRETVAWYIGNGLL